MKKLIVDTDIGVDIDDAFALAFLSQTSCIDLLGVTTVAGNTQQKAQLTAELLERFDRGDVPVFSGEERALMGERIEHSSPPQYRAVAPRKQQFSSAIPFLCEQAKKQKDLTVLTLGPLTNIARCIKKDPEAFRKVRFVIMGGMLTSAFSEGNISSDPEAAEIVFGEGYDITLVSLDTTLSVHIPAEVWEALGKSSHQGVQLLCTLMELWTQDVYVPMAMQWGKEPPTGPVGSGAHDVIAAMVLTHPQRFTYRRTKVLIETQGNYTRGVTKEDINVFSNLPNGCNCQVVDRFYREDFLKIIQTTLMKGG